MLLEEGPAKPERDRLEAFIARCAKGDMEGLAALYEDSRGAVYGYALSVLGNVHDAEEITQDVFINICQSAGGYRARGNPMAWILTITRNLSLNRLKDRSRTAPLEIETFEALADNPSVTQEDRLALRTMLSALGDEDRQIVALHAITGLKHREIASFLDMPLPTVLSRYNRAIKKLQKAWREDV